jgi:hypothetical protein
VRILAALVLLASFVLGGEQASTAANAVSSTRAGSGSAAISGYTVTDVAYELAGAQVASVSFRLDPGGARKARIRLTTAGGAWHSCELTDNVAACPTPGESLAAASALEVVAAD